MLFPPPPLSCAYITSSLLMIGVLIRLHYLNELQQSLLLVLLGERCRAVTPVEMLTRRMSTRPRCGGRARADAAMCFGVLWMREVHLDAASGRGLLFSSVRREARSLIRTHLLVRETSGSDYTPPPPPPI